MTKNEFQTKAVAEEMLNICQYALQKEANY